MSGKAEVLHAVVSAFPWSQIAPLEHQLIPDLLPGFPVPTVGLQSNPALGKPADPRTPRVLRGEINRIISATKIQRVNP
jgi:hypothetical protein